MIRSKLLPLLLFVCLFICGKHVCVFVGWAYIVWWLRYAESEIQITNEFQNILSPFSQQLGIGTVIARRIGICSRIVLFAVINVNKIWFNGHKITISYFHNIGVIFGLILFTDPIEIHLLLLFVIFFWFFSHLFVGVKRKMSFLWQNWHRNIIVIRNSYAWLDLGIGWQGAYTIHHTKSF